jgi:hypothetical protein
MEKTVTAEDARGGAEKVLKLTDTNGTYAWRRREASDKSERARRANDGAALDEHVGRRLGAIPP